MKDKDSHPLVRSTSVKFRSEPNSNESSRKLVTVMTEAKGNEFEAILEIHIKQALERMIKKRIKKKYITIKIENIEKNN